MPYIVVLTGTIASGKSTALAFFKQQGIDTISADEIARELTSPNTPAFEAIIAHFGRQITNQDGTLNRRKLRYEIIRHPNERKWLESYLHPQIRSSIQSQLEQTSSAYVVIEIPLITRREDFPYLNHVLLLEIQEEHQIARLMKRDQCTRAEALQMIQMQPDKTVRRAIADDIVFNDGHAEHFEATLRALHQRYLMAAAQEA